MCIVALRHLPDLTRLRWMNQARLGPIHFRRSVGSPVVIGGTFRSLLRETDAIVESGPSLISHITLVAKCAGARRAGNPHAACDAAGVETELGDGLRHRHRAKAAGKLLLPVPNTTAPALDPTRRLEQGAQRSFHQGQQNRRAHGRLQLAIGIDAPAELSSTIEADGTIHAGA
jgi:hypothetical protein